MVQAQHDEDYMSLLGRRSNCFLKICSTVTMAEIIGVFASVITLTQVLGASVKLARTWFHAATELDKVQASVPPFSITGMNREAARKAFELFIERLVLEACACLNRPDNDDRPTSRSTLSW